MRTMRKLGWTAGMLCLGLLLTEIHGAPAKTAPSPRKTAPSPVAQGTNGTQVALVPYTICPVAVIMVYCDFTEYEAHVCHPGYEFTVNWPGPTGLNLGTCGNNTDCVNAGDDCRMVGQVGITGLPRMMLSNEQPKLSAGVTLLDSQFVDLVLDSSSPSAPHRFRLDLVRYKSKDGNSRVAAVGYEVVPDGRSAEVFVAPRDVDVIAEHCCLIRLGSVQYKVLTHTQTPSLK